MWLFNSSIGRKFIMALTGICLVLFVTFHVLMNAVAICCPVGYNKVCEFLGANWYALAASAGLGLLVVIHVIYAIMLTIQNRSARGKNAYAVNSLPKSVEWSSKNMLVLGFVVLAFLGVHLIQFWARMQAQEVMGSMYQVDGVHVLPAAGTLFLQLAFQEWYTPVIYILGFIALWFHMNHGFWSMFQSIGWNNTKWIPRLKCISKWWVTIVVGLFTLQAVVFTYRAYTNYYLTDTKLRTQYIEMYNKYVEEHAQELSNGVMSAQLESEYVNSQVAAAGNDAEAKAALEVKRVEAQGKVEQVNEVNYAKYQEIQNMVNHSLVNLSRLAKNKVQAAEPKKKDGEPQPTVQATEEITLEEEN